MTVMATSLTSLLTGLGENTLAYAIIMLVLGIIGQLVLAARKYRHEREVAELSAEEALQKHTTEISIQLLEQLRAELARAIVRNAELETYVDRARRLARHLEDILSATTPEEKAAAEALAQAYLESVQHAP